MSARDRVIAYLLSYPGKLIDKDELMVVSAGADWLRHVADLRSLFGWSIYSGATIMHMAEGARIARNKGELASIESAFGDPRSIDVDQHVLVRTYQDRGAACRWYMLRDIKLRKRPAAARLLEYFRTNVGEQITCEELRYLTGSEWARRTLNSGPNKAGR